MAKSESGISAAAAAAGNRNKQSRVKSHLSKKPGLSSDALCENMTYPHPYFIL